MQENEEEGKLGWEDEINGQGLTANTDWSWMEEVSSLIPHLTLSFSDSDWDLLTQVHVNIQKCTVWDVTDTGSSRQNVTMNSAAEALHKFNHSFLLLLLVTVINSRFSLRVKNRICTSKSLLTDSKKQVNFSCSKCPGILCVCLFTSVCVCVCAAMRMCVVAPLCSVNLGRCCLSEPSYGLMLSLMTEAVWSVTMCKLSEGRKGLPQSHI